MNEILKLCPFCGCSLEDFGHTRENGKTVMSYIHPDSDCVLSRLVFTEKKWNRRAPATLPTVEELSSLLMRQTRHSQTYCTSVAKNIHTFLTRRMGGKL